jgi:hypothetical protein
MLTRLLSLTGRNPGTDALKARVLDMTDRLNWVRNRIRHGELLPNFAIIGAQKAATTSLHYYLSQHPEIFMSQHKEHNLFLADSDEKGSYYEFEPFSNGSSSRYKRGGLTDDQILRRMFRGYGGERIIGDASPYYACAPSASVETPERMYEQKPTMRLVYSLRNPLERIISNYLHDVRTYERMGQPMSEDFNIRLCTRPHLLDTSLYFMQLKRYLDFFPQDQIHVLLYEDLLARPDATLAAVAKFLSVEEEFKFDTRRSHNAAMNSEPNDELVYSRENFTRLMQPIRRDIAAMENFLGRSLAIWDLSEEHWCQVASGLEETGPKSKTTNST